MQVHGAPSCHLPGQVHEGHGHLFDEFIAWIDGGAPSDTQISDNIKSFIMVIAAMETTDDGNSKQMAEYLKDLE